MILVSARAYAVTERVSYASIDPTALEEDLQFDAVIPHRVSIRGFQREALASLHYASTLEIALMDGLRGEFIIAGQRYDVSVSRALVIPPGVLHASRIERSAGRMYNIKIAPRAIRAYLDIEQILAFDGLTLGDLDTVNPEFDRLKALALRLVACDGQIFERMQTVLAILEVLARYTKPKTRAPDAPSSSNALLKALVDWTLAHCGEPVTLESAAGFVGFSRTYFCRWFRSLTNMTYIDYLRRVRIGAACLRLMEGLSVSECAEVCGFESVSYFTQCFRRVEGCTPTEYRLRNKSS